MAIDLFSLNKPEATLVRPQTQPIVRRLNTEKIKENWEQLKAESTDLVLISKEAGTYESSVSLDGLKQVGELTRTCEYSLDVFFRDSAPKASGTGEYSIGGVLFGKEELEQCRMVLRAAADSIGCGVGKNVNIDYKHYAEMGIAESSVRAFADAHLTKEQAAVVNRAMQEYNEALVEFERQTVENGDYVRTEYEGLSEYYGLARVLSEGEIKVINELRAEISRLTGKYYEPKEFGMTAGVQSATNEALKNNITELFTNVDVTDARSVNAAVERYKELMRPAYIAYGMNDTHGSLTKVLNQDAANFRAQITKLTAAVNYKATDYKA